MMNNCKYLFPPYIYKFHCVHGGGLRLQVIGNSAGALTVNTFCQRSVCENVVSPSGPKRHCKLQERAVENVKRLIFIHTVVHL